MHTPLLKPLLTLLALAFLATLALRADNLPPGPIIGIGAEIRSVHDHPTVVNIVPGSPADKHGVKTGDRIVSIDDQNVDGLPLTKVAGLLRGAENSRVHLTVNRNGHEVKLTMRREILTLQPSGN